MGQVWSALAFTYNKDDHGWVFKRRDDLERICHDFYKKNYKHKEISEEALTEVLEAFLRMISQVVIVLLTRDITKNKLSMAVTCMAKGNALGHDGIPMEFFLKLWLIVGHDFHRMVFRGIKKGILLEGVTKGFTSLILKRGTPKISLQLIK